MAKEWRKLSIEEVADVIGGGTPSTKDPSNFNGEIPWITPKDLSGYNNRYILKGQRNISYKGLSKSNAKLIPAGTVLLTTRAPVGYVAIAANTLTTNQGFHSLIPHEGYSSEFLYYLLKANKEYLKSNASGTTFGELSGKVLKKLSFNFPPLPEQRAIAHILGTLDDKIELNRRMNETLEAMARALFKAWFVDFEPVRAKMEGRWKRGQSLPGLPAHLYDLFPDRLVDSELGEIPEGWGIGKLEEAFEIIMGQSPPGSTYNENGDGLPFYQGRVDFGFRFPTRRIYCTEPKRIAEPGDTLVSVRAPVGDINVALERCCIGRGIAAVRHKTRSFSYTYYFMQSLEMIFNNFEAEGTVFGAISKKDFLSIRIILPPNQLIKKFEMIVNPFDNQIKQIESESRTLINLRDTILPKLMCGEIRIKDVESFLKDHGV